MPGNVVSQRTIVELMRALREQKVNYMELLYANDFRDWFVGQADTYYRWNWTEILMELRNGHFFFASSGYWTTATNITGAYLSENDARLLGEDLIQRLAALATSLPTGKNVLRSLQLDGFDVNREKLTLIPLEGAVVLRQKRTP